MTSKMFLTSVAAVMLAMPAMAEPWPSNDIMLEDKTYDNAATEEHMLVSADGATANAAADYEAILYQIAAGKYLPANTEYDNETGTGAVECESGYYCGGLTGATYSSSLQGREACPEGYAQSASGASSDTQCYRLCENSDVSHAESVSGGVYYNGTADGNNQCSAETCVKGYHKENAFVKNSILTDTIGSVKGTSYGRIDNNNGYNDYGTGLTKSDSGLTEKNTWATYWAGKGTVYGTGRCSTQQGFTDGTTNSSTYTNPTIKDTLEDETGASGAQYCYCNITGYGDGNGNNIGLSSAWVFRGDLSSAYYCAGLCASYCASYVLDDVVYNLRFRAALFGSVGAPATLATCAANTINIQWDGIDEPTTVKYDGDITTPVSAEKRPGQRFKGWKFTTPGQTTGD